MVCFEVWHACRLLLGMSCCGCLEDAVDTRIAAKPLRLRWDAHSHADSCQQTVFRRNCVECCPCALQLTGRQRPGVSQFSQPHLLLKRGMKELSNMFGSDFEQMLLDAGGVSVNWLEECTAVSTGFRG